MDDAIKALLRQLRELHKEPFLFEAQEEHQEAQQDHDPPFQQEIQQVQPQHHLQTVQHFRGQSYGQVQC